METDACCPSLLILHLFHPPLPLNFSPVSCQPAARFTPAATAKQKKKKEKGKTSTLSTIPRTHSPSIWLILPMDCSRYDPRLRDGLVLAPRADGPVQTIVWAAQKCCVHFNESQRGDEAAICSLARRLLPGSPIRCTSDDKRASPFFPFLREDPIKFKLSQSGFRVTALLWLVSPYFRFFFFFFF